MRNKVCLFVWNNFLNDARVARECSALAEIDYDVRLVCLRYSNDGLQKCVEENRVKVHRIKTRRYYNNSLFTKLVKYLVPFWKMIVLGYKSNADIYQSNDLNTLTQGVICAKLRVRKRILVYDSHEVHTEREGYNGQGIYWLERVLLKYVDEIITTTETRAKYYADKYQIHKPLVIHNYPAMHTNEYVPKYNLYKLLMINKDKKILIYQGGLQKGRGIEILVESMQLVTGAVLVIIGNGQQEGNIKALVERMSLSDKVKFIDTVDKSELKFYTMQGYLGFQTIHNTCFNHFSTLSNKLFEYIMACVPVVASKGMPEIEKYVCKNGVGVLCDTTKPRELAEQTMFLLTHFDTHNELIRNCMKARVKFNWNNEKKKYCNIFLRRINDDK